MGWFIVMVMLMALVMALGAARVSGRESDREAAERARVYQIRVDRISPEVTPVPEPEKTAVPVPTPWARYDVRLDDDLQRYIEEVCREYEVSAALVMAMIEIETQGTFDPETIGDDGDSIGLMQIQPKWHGERMERLGVTDLTDPRQNILVGVDFMAELMAAGHGAGWALSLYNSGNAVDGADYAFAVQCRAEQLWENVQPVNE